MEENMPLGKAFHQNGDSSSLVVLMHGLYTHIRMFTGVIGEINSHLPDADILQPVRKDRFYNGDPFELASELEAMIRETYEDSQMRANPYQRIILIGYSMGAVLIKKAYAYGRGSEEDRPGTEGHTEPNAWTNRVERIILLAGINRGWSSAERPKNMGAIQFFIYHHVLAPFARFLPVTSLLRAIERGSPFIANLRVQWVRLIQKDPSRVAPVLQLLGTVDTLVTADDARDLVIHDDFIFIPVEGATHSSLVRFDHQEIGQRCRERFVEALTGRIPDLRKKYENNPADKSRKEIDLTEKDIIFVLHGIRDFGGWTGKLRDELVSVAKELKKPDPEVVTAKYKFFPMGPFLLFPARQDHVRWFMDQYTERLAKFPNPNNRVSFIGHSNGTYILASALEQYRTMKVHHVSFAGSVVPRDYNWENFITNQHRVEKLRNDLAASDWPVALFPKVFDQFNWSDIGSGGFDGFVDNAANKDERTYKGGHSAAIAKANHNSLAKFALTGEIVRDEGLLTESPPFVLQVLSRASAMVWILLLVLVFGSIYFILDRFGIVTGALYVLFLLYAITQF